jgi:uncharacterized protein YkwD
VGRRSWLPNLVGVALLVGIVALGVAIVRGGGDAGSSVVTPALFGIGRDASQPLYPRDDPWLRYLAPERVCPGGEERDAPPAAQERTMVCLLNWARSQRGLPALPVNPVLSQAARLKALDIEVCEDFAHEACGKDADAVAEAVGYRGGAWGENLYAGSSVLGSPRVAVDRWLNSTGHRENLFREEWSEQGVALRAAPSFRGAEDVALWVSHFGRR